jgi:hypothetical protein
MNKPHFLGSDLMLGALIAFLSILTAFTSWQFSSTDGAGADYNRKGLLMLTDANAEYLVANQDIIQDYTYYDTYYLNYETNPEVADYYQENFSPSLTANLEREAIFDEQYYAEMYQTPQEMFDEADRLFELAGEVGNRSDRIQLSTLIFAVALSFTAWGSLLEKDSKLRLLFSVLALLVMVAGLVVFFTAPPMPA